APVVREVTAGDAGIVQAIDGEALGLAVVELGGGRKRDGDKINPSVGLSELAALGEAVTPDLPLALVHAANADAAEAAAAAVRAAFTLGESHPNIPPLVHRRLR
ncbi:MAG: thymidine phosphorylase, partial [Paracoccaceae bacterium]